MPLIDKLEGIFNVEAETSIESAIMEFVKGGENIKQKTIIPFDKQILAVAFAFKLGEDIDEEFSDVISVLNSISGIPNEIKGQKNPESISFSSMLPDVIYEGMNLMPSLGGKSRVEFGNAIANIRSQEVTVRQPDSVDKIKSLIHK